MAILTFKISKFLVTVSVFMFVALTRISSASNRCDERKQIRLLSRCEECSLNRLMRCPSPYIHSSTGIGIRGCRIRIRFGSIGVVTVPGCQHSCDRFDTFRQCCSGYWGSRCQACPGGTPVCNGAGKCFDKLHGNGTCSCQDGFNGTACEMCKNSNMFGPGCNQTCSCQRGICENSVNSSGECQQYSCQIGYFGANCNIRHPHCHQSVSCASNAECFNLNNTDTCICNPGYTGDGKTTCTAINPCKGNSHGCHGKAACSYLGPGKHSCNCIQGYRGDGKICLVIDPCGTNRGGCPKNSSVCNFLSPGKSNCSCLPGFANFTSGYGCSMIDLCNDGNHGGCDVNANCLMVKADEKRCICKKGYRGNGTVCHGNIVKRVKQLNDAGPPGVKGLLSLGNLVLAHTLARPLSDTGPFTALIPTDAAINALPIKQKLQLLADIHFASHVFRLHLVASDLDSIALKKTGKVTTLQGPTAVITQENGELFYSVNGISTKAKIIASDFVAGNGIVHIIDKVFLYPGNFSFNATATLSPITAMERDEKFSKFAALIQATDFSNYLSSLGVQATVFAPSNSAVNFDNLTMNYFTTTAKGKEKLRSIIKNHFVAGKLEVTDLMSIPRVMSLEGESQTLQRKNDGSIFIGKKSRIIESNIVVKDGVIHRIDHVLIPSAMLPLVPNYAYNTTYTFARGVCYRCDTMPSFPNKGCPNGYAPLGGFTGCAYQLTTFHGVFRFSGCRTKYCRKTNKIPECNKGYYGSNCRPCPGPLEQPCYLQGTCDDRIRGSGQCSCQPMFTGVACEKCKNTNTFGPTCNKTCTCVHGQCNNGMDGNGTCKPNSCKSGYHGNNCDLTDKKCGGSPSILCHFNAHCVNVNSRDICQCNAGYEGPGVMCYEVDPCKKSDRGGCHKDAKCVKTGPGKNNCTCDQGFRGDGSVCIAINPCNEGFQHRCHSNAKCIFTGPGQSSCKCNAGYTGNGKSCIEINPCLVNNGDCSAKARCYRVGPGQHNCSCFYGYVGDGYSCLGSVAILLQEDKRFSAFYRSFVKDVHLDYFLSRGDKSFTVFVPTNDAVNNIGKNDSVYWKSTIERMKYFLKYSLVNETLTEKDLITGNARLLALNGQTLNVKYQNNQTLVNGEAQIIQPNITAANGIIHMTDKILIPLRLPKSRLPSVFEALSKEKELSSFYNKLKLQTNDFQTKIKNCVGCTIFAPVNDVLSSLEWRLTLQTIKYHVIPKFITPDVFYNGQHFSTMLGLNFIVKLTKQPTVNKINGLKFGNPIKAKNYVIYKLSGILEIPTSNRCDYRIIRQGYTLCRFCFFPRNCPSGWVKLRTASCSFWIFRGCRALCRKTTIVKKCCSGFWGADCQACPGTPTSPCYRHGKCSDGISGSGHCQCSANFTGTACEKCIPGKYGKQCASKCACVNGMCNEGIHGDGTCRCYNGWQGPNCNDRTNPAKCSPKVCHKSASCRSVNSSYDCNCDAGFTGNGTQCQEINACDTNNGGCHKNATCEPHLNEPTKLATCKCKKGYTGDGWFCSEVDKCQENNGGCHANATCSSLGPGLRNCHCNDGYHGNGIVCRPDNPCEENHGGCSLRASCQRTGPGQRKCKCRAGYYGDGEFCVGNSMEVLENDPELSKMKDLYKKYKLDTLFTSGAKTNILAPTNEALAKILNQKKRKRRSVSSSPSVEQYLRYHVIGCVKFNNYTTKSGKFISLLGAPIWVFKNDSGLFFMDAQKNMARMTKGFQSANGFVFKLDAVLTPPAEFVNLGDSSKPYIKVANELGYTTATSLMKTAGLENILSNRLGRPYLLFISTNQAITKLPNKLKTRLSSPAHVDELITYIKYHVIHNAPVNSSTEFFIRSGGGVELRTMQGQSLFVSCKGDKGDLYVNGISRISKRDILFDGGVAFAIDDILVPLGLGGKCDEIVHQKTYGRCSNCLSPESCPQDSTLVGTTNHSCSFDGGIVGCQHICMRRKIVRKCCQDYYGADCRACPGGVGKPCSKRGQCDDGLTGSGNCTCSSGYNGTACEKCVNGNNCSAPRFCQDNNGGCHVFATCSHSSGVLSCTCQSGYEGDGFYCQMKDPCTVNNGGCTENATCHFTGPNQRRCQCKQGFYEVNGYCQAHASSSPCATNHGGCSNHADCKVAANGTALCKCWSTYVGNGVSCHGNIIQTLEDTVKVTAFYKALFHLKEISEGKKLFSDLQIDSKFFTVFAPIDSAVRAQAFNITVVKNHVVSGRIKLSSIYNVSTVVNLLGTKVMILKRKNGGVTINGVAHVLGDVQTTNGVIYIIDQTLPIVGKIPSTPTPPSTTQQPSRSTSSSSPPTASSSPSSPRTKSSTAPFSPTAIPVSIKKNTTTLPHYNTTIAPTTTGKPGVVAGQRKDKGLSGGAITGIVILVLAVVLLVGLVIWYLRRKALPRTAFKYKRENDTVVYDSDVFPEPVPSVSYNNPMYDTSEPGPSQITVHEDKGLPPPFVEQEHTEFANPLYLEMQNQSVNDESKKDESKKEESTDDGPDDVLSLEDNQTPGEEQC